MNNKIFINDLLTAEILKELSTINKNDIKDFQGYLLAFIKQFKQDKERQKMWDSLDYNINLAQTIKQARLNKKIGLRRLADSIGEKASDISLMEAGLMEYTEEVLKKLADVLELDYNTLVNIK